MKSTTLSRSGVMVRAESPTSARCNRHKVREESEVQALWKCVGEEHSKRKLHFCSNRSVDAWKKSRLFTDKQNGFSQNLAFFTIWIMSFKLCAQIQVGRCVMHRRWRNGVRKTLWTLDEANIYFSCIALVVDGDWRKKNKNKKDKFQKLWLRSVYIHTSIYICFVRPLLAQHGLGPFDIWWHSSSLVSGWFHKHLKTV